MSSLERDPLLRSAIESAHQSDAASAPPFSRLWARAKAQRERRAARHPLKVAAALSLVVGGLAVFSFQELAPYFSVGADPVAVAWPKADAPELALEFLLDDPGGSDALPGSELGFDETFTPEPTKGLLP